MSSIAFKEAGLGRRFWALFLDSYGSYVIASALEPQIRSSRLLLQLGIFFVEVSIMTSLQGASFGQMIAKLKVIDARTGAALPIPRVLLRTLLIITVLPALFRSGGRLVHDILTNSVVVRRYKLRESSSEV